MNVTTLFAFLAVWALLAFIGAVLIGRAVALGERRDRERRQLHSQSESETDGPLSCTQAARNAADDAATRARPGRGSPEFE